MNYENIYHKIIDNRIQNPPINEYTEHHHIIPKSLGGTDDKNNLVALTAREHYICHLLLTKIYSYGTPEWCKMIKAFAYMCYGQCDDHKRYSNSRFYSYLKDQYSVAQSILSTGDKNSQFGSRWIHNLNLKKCAKLPKDDPLPDGWHFGRIIDFDKYTAENILKEQIETLKIENLRSILYYYRDNNISMRSLSEKFNVGRNVYIQFEKYFKDEYYEIVKNKPRNSNTTKGRYKV